MLILRMGGTCRTQRLKRAAHEQRRTSAAKEAAEKVASWRKSVPQRLKPHCKCMTCGTAEAVPLSKTDFFSIL
jgi:hypothetical protein